MHLRLTTKLEKQEQEEQTHLRNDTQRETERDKHETPTTTTTTTTALLKKQTLKKNCLQKGVCRQWATLLWTSNPINTI